MSSKVNDKSRNKDGVITEEEYIALKKTLNNSEMEHKRKGFVILMGLIVGISCFIFTFMESEWAELPMAFKVLVSSICALITGICSSYIYKYLFILYNYKIYAKVNEYEIRNLHEKAEEDIFENAVKLSYKYLDQYYLQIRDQAQKGFVVTVCVSVFGALLIGFGIVLMFMDITNPSYITCASGVITEFIATIFFYMYNKTVTSMSKYHNKLVLSHNVSIALKVADTLPEKDKVKSKNLIISELLKDMNSHLIRSDSEDTKK